ncbi:uncharacterized protein PF3D7_1120600 [Neodiprion pinetum]|uniref:uncharacterized protein PF3D7_1120600 n=1 Tax=Neodiprion pinetum TaxID=441929 RepID=UPI001EDF1607|nr:uncharacterized protein LOC124217045 [Neodiprion pinetum]
MCDLIDLNSPDPRNSVCSRLPSPLIPGPTIVADNNDNKKLNIVEFVRHGKRSSLENNPFDKVYKETADYMAKKDDPFEVILQKALQSNNQSSQKLAKRSKHREDFSPKCRRHSDVLKVNRTLDEPLMGEILNKHLNHVQKLSWNLSGNQSIISDLNNTNLLQDNCSDSLMPKSPFKNVNSFPTPIVTLMPPSPENSSLLNQSAMNDSLSEVKENLVENNAKGILDVKDSGFSDHCQNPTDLENLLVKSSMHRRSLSQGNKPLLMSPDKEETTFRPRSKSTADTNRTRNIPSNPPILSVSNASSRYTDFMNNGFIDIGSNTVSDLLDISKISGTPRPSYYSYGSLSSMNSDGTNNKAFMLDSESSKVLKSISSAKSSLNLSNVSRTTRPGDYLMKTPLKTSVRMSDLALRLEKVKLQSVTNIGELPLYSPNHKVKNFLQLDEVCSDNTKMENCQENDVQKESKLIDIDCDSYNATSVSNHSLDSVFIENNNKVDPIVLQDAKLLSRTFAEAAEQFSSCSFNSSDDLLSTSQWNFDFLPASDDEIVVDNLIELPVSPAKGETSANSDQNGNPTEIASSKPSDSVICQGFKDLESEFIDQDHTTNKVMAATLLLDLEKIVHRENNPEAITLLENLEKVLGINCESNAQLLATCMQGTNNLSKSPKRCLSKLSSIENIRHENLEKSHEDNDLAGMSNSMKVLKIQNDVSLEMNLNDKKEINKIEKSVIPDFSPSTEENTANLSEKFNSSNTVENEQKEVQVDQAEALELITNLSKILGGRNNESSPLSLLTNLRKVLNLATNQLNFENCQTTKSKNRDTPKEANTEALSQKKTTAGPEHNTQRSETKTNKIKPERKKSIDSTMKTQCTPPVLHKRSMSLSGPKRNSTPTAVLSKAKEKKDSDSTKRASSCSALPKSGTIEKSSSIGQELGKGRASVIGVTGIYKLKKKSIVESASKKGPLKALIPVGNMQRRGSLGSKGHISIPRTPPKSSSNVPPTFTFGTSSTPNPIIPISIAKKSPRNKPVASSTPDGGGSRSGKMKLQVSKNMAKPRFSCNISPVSPLPTHGISSGSKGSPKNYRHNKTLSPPKKRNSQGAQGHNATLSSIPKYSPLAKFSKDSFKEALKTFDISGSPTKSLVKSNTPKKAPFVHSKSESQILKSPLKTMNNQTTKFKPFNLISKICRGNSGSKLVDKENCG